MADSAQVTYEKGKLYDLNIADLHPDPEQPRKLLFYLISSNLPLMVRQAHHERKIK